MKHSLKVYFVLIVSSVSGFASTALDDTYGFRRTVPFVLNLKEEPVHGEHVETVLLEALSKDLRFEYDPAWYRHLREASLKLENLALGMPGEESLANLAPLLEVAAKDKVQSLYLAELQKDGEELFIFLALVIPQNQEVVRSHRELVRNRFSLDSFAASAQRALKKLEEAIPFEGTVLSREGYRVVLDRGSPTLISGMRIPAFTIERNQFGLNLEETGTILVTRSEKSLSFGKVIVEKHPHTIVVGNKFRTGGDEYINRLGMGKDAERALASVQKMVPPRGRLGTMNLDLGASAVTLSQTVADGSSNTSQNVLFPGGILRTELWVTGRVILDFELGLSSATLNSAQDESLNSSLTTFKGQVGYRVNLAGNSLGPTLFLRTGYGSYRLIVDRAVDPLFFNSSTFKGWLVGAGAEVSLTDKFGVGASLSTFLASSLDEGAVTSGETVDDLLGLDVALRGYYALGKDFDLEVKILLQNFNARFSGTGTRSVSLASSSRSLRALQVGLTYFF